jgi:hypothetical protein
MRPLLVLGLWTSSQTLDPRFWKQSLWLHVYTCNNLQNAHKNLHLSPWTIYHSSFYGSGTYYIWLLLWGICLLPLSLFWLQLQLKCQLVAENLAHDMFSNQLSNHPRGRHSSWGNCGSPTLPRCNPCTLLSYLSVRKVTLLVE